MGGDNPVKTLKTLKKLKKTIDKLICSCYNEYRN